MTPAEASARIGGLRAEYEDVGGFAKIDTTRGARTGFPEVVYAEGKTPAQVTTIMRAMIQSGEGNVMASRVSPQAADEIQAALKVRPSAASSDWCAWSASPLTNSCGRASMNSRTTRNRGSSPPRVWTRGRTKTRTAPSQSRVCCARARRICRSRRRRP